MFKNLINLFTKQSDEIKTKINEPGILALSAIFIRIAKLDGSFDSSERKKIKELVMSRFELDEEETEKVLNLAVNLEGQSNDNIQFTKIIKETIAYEEDGFMRLFCNLLGLSDKDNALARQFISKKQENS